MILIAEQIGFSHAHTVNKLGDKEVRDKKSRWELWNETQRRTFVFLSLGSDYLLDALQDLGFYDDNGFAKRSVRWSEILAFAESTLSIREPWELRAVEKMSRAYLRGLRRGEDAFAIPPGFEEDDDDEL